MAFISSPITYPPSSSPLGPTICQKRKSPTDHPYPARRSSFRKQVIEKDLPGLSTRPKNPSQPTRPKGPFLDDDDDDDDEEVDAKGVDQEDSPPSTSLRSRDAANNDLGIDLNHDIDVPNVGSQMRTSTGRSFPIRRKQNEQSPSFERLMAERSITEPGKATKSFYGVDIHGLLDQATKHSARPKNVTPVDFRASNGTQLPCHESSKRNLKCRSMLWTEKYRARKFTDLVGDDRTHRDVLRWLKAWDSIVFPGLAKPTPLRKTTEVEDAKTHKKILMLTGPPGLGKTTLAHVCARQAGYEVMEINASDERSSAVVRGRIKDAAGTETVRGAKRSSKQGKTPKAGRPVCVVIDEVDGVVAGIGAGGEGGFVKALIDLVALDQKSSQPLTSTTGNVLKTKHKGERFRLMRPLILICNDAYHPSLRPLRTSTVAEIIHIRNPPLDKVVTRLKAIFDAEGLPCDSDGVRRLCEATWGVGSRKSGSEQASSEGDLRGCLVVGEWAASKLRACYQTGARLTKHWVEENLTESLGQAGGGSRGLGRGGTKEAVDRVFLEGAGISRSEPRSQPSHFSTAEGDSATGVREAARRTATDRLREVIETTGESDRIVTDCFAAYASLPFQDDTFLTKPNTACDWLHFHDQLSSKVHVGQEWELGAYLSSPILALHHLFASPARQNWGSQRKFVDEPDESQSALAGPKAHFIALEMLKQNTAVLQGLQTSLTIPLMRSFRSIKDLSMELVPSLMRMMTPEVQPVTVGGSGDQAGVVSVRKGREKEMIAHAVGVMHAVGLTFERARVDTGRNGLTNWIYRMEPQRSRQLDHVASFETASQKVQNAGPTRYAIRQAMDQEYQRYIAQKSAEARQARYQAGGDTEVDALPFDAVDFQAKTLVEHSHPNPAAVKRDFFGRPIEDHSKSAQNVTTGNKCRPRPISSGKGKAGQVWVSFHEGFSNAVRKPITLAELLRDM
ncbi:uncharacterized protein KY384_007464 [Bacidia gigantensis]|uniref:uncharacterized protein n=1 Tax=Bacidia gigantensis TaxID=2732470 RepID=UPI001D03DCC7|nr:uncharacterized protein KY384_007464 [Bacidia gigantensis]KAG8528546.1 hypothetical protein KY384_007464 [Bacidia gigantensis]